MGGVELAAVMRERRPGIRVLFVSGYAEGIAAGEHFLLVGIQDLGDRERVLFDAFAVDERESAALVERVLADAADGLAGVQFITDQGTPYVAEATKQAYDALGVEHAPQREGTPTEKATVERGFGTVKNALAPILGLLDRLAAAMPQLQQPKLAQSVATLLVATFLRVYAAGRRHLGHPLDGHDPDVLRAIVEEQRENARAEDRSVRLFLEAMHAEYAMPGSAEAFVRAHRRYPLDDLKEAERRICTRACRCHVHACDRYFTAVVRDVYDHATRRRAGERRQRVAEAQARRDSGAAQARVADLDAHPERRLLEGLDVLADTWLPDAGEFVTGGQLARLWLRRAVDTIFATTPLGALDCIEAHVRSWLAANPSIPQPLCDAVRGVLRDVIADVQAATNRNPPTRPVADILKPATRSTRDNERPPPPPHLRI